MAILVDGTVKEITMLDPEIEKILRDMLVKVEEHEERLTRQADRVARLEGRLLRLETRVVDGLQQALPLGGAEDGDPEESLGGRETRRLYIGDTTIRMQDRILYVLAKRGAVVPDFEASFTIANEARRLGDKLVELAMASGAAIRGVPSMTSAAVAGVCARFVVRGVLARGPQAGTYAIIARHATEVGEAVAKIDTLLDFLVTSPPAVGTTPRA